jgi:threonine dehydrogenase-like Zn-dependent dehydrogenase
MALIMRSLAVDVNGKLSIVEISQPIFDDCRMLVKTLSCGVCNGTDAKIIHRNFKNFDTYPALLGHEGVGEIVEIGKQVKHVKLGDRILLPFIEGKLDNFYSGWGAYSEYAVCGDWRAMAENGQGPETDHFWEGYYAQQKIPSDFDPVEASMIITFREVLSAVKRFGLAENQNLVIFGAGPVGLSFLKFAKLMGMGPIIVFDIVDEKLIEAEKMGADFVYNSNKVDVKQEVLKIDKEGVDFCLDAVGINSLINQSLELVKYNGKVCIYGISAALGMDLKWDQAPYNWNIHFLQWPSKYEESLAHQQIISWIQMGILDPKDFISDIIPFENILDAFEKIENGTVQKKIIIQY